MTDIVSRPVATLTGTDNYFEDFAVGQKMRHARGTTVDEVENSSSPSSS